MYATISYVREQLYENVNSPFIKTFIKENETTLEVYCTCHRQYRRETDRYNVKGIGIISLWH